MREFTGPSMLCDDRGYPTDATPLDDFWQMRGSEADVSTRDDLLGVPWMFRPMPSEFFPLDTREFP